MDEDNETVDELRDVLRRNGFVRCDIDACNCGSWHARYGLPERYDEVKDMLAEAGHPLCNENGNLVRNALKALIDERGMLHNSAMMPNVEGNRPPRKLADLVLSMELVTDAGLVARRLAREVLGITDHGSAPAMNPITTNGTTRLIPDDEPVFLVRGQDNVAGATVRAWADMAAANGADAEILRIAREHAVKMDEWPKKKTADLPANAALTGAEGVRVEGTVMQKEMK